MTDTENKKKPLGQSERLARNTLNRLDSCLSPTSDQRQCAFGYVAKPEDIIIRGRSGTGWLLLIPGALIALGTSIAVYRESNGQHNTSTVLLVLPVLQLLATAAVWLWVRDRFFPHVWVRSYSPDSRFTVTRSVRRGCKPCNMPTRLSTFTKALKKKLLRAGSPKRAVAFYAALEIFAIHTVARQK
jgi:hypothetical protein